MRQQQLTKDYARFTTLLLAALIRLIVDIAWPGDDHFQRAHGVRRTHQAFVQPPGMLPKRRRGRLLHTAYTFTELWQQDSLLAMG